MPRVLAERLLQLAGVALWLAVGLPGLRTAPWAWIAAWVVWLASFLAFTSRDEHRGPRPVLLLVVQVAGVLVMAAVDRGNESTLLLAVAGQLPFAMPAGAALAWVVAQTVALVLVTGPPGEPARLVAFATFELFAVSAALLAVREARARAELAALNAELLATRELLAEGSRAGERLRIARDLHDTLGHHLTALTLNLEAAAHAEGPSVREHVHRAQAVARLLLAEVRAVVSDMREEKVIDLGHALGTLVAAVDHPRVHLDVAPGLDVRDARQAEIVFRCVQEIVTNARRHGGARNVYVRVAAPRGELEVDARDDGGAAPAGAPGHGLLRMRERVEEAGGRLEAGPHPEGGFRVHAVVPARA